MDTDEPVIEELLRQLNELRGLLFEARTERDALKARIRAAQRELAKAREG